ncbi:MAG: hypothetical protein ACLP1X_24145 [Polyangiaceae bacterium]|jgi:hypothetical protein
MTTAELRTGMTGLDFETALRKLVAVAARSTANVGSLECEGCERCEGCTFCASSKGLARCHYCTGCDDCTDCTHCSDCRACTACQRCVGCERCVGSAYLVRSIGCNGCSYCFGCVGLWRRDFCVLNEQYDRAAYFELTSRLARELGVKV